MLKKSIIIGAATLAILAAGCSKEPGVIIVTAKGVTNQYKNITVAMKAIDLGDTVYLEPGIHQVVGPKIPMPNIMTNQYQKSIDQFGNAAFEAGIQSAINAHLIYMQTEMSNGNLPSRAGMEIPEWKKQARLIWANQVTNVKSN